MLQLISITADLFKTMIDCIDRYWANGLRSQWRFQWRFAMRFHCVPYLFHCVVKDLWNKFIKLEKNASAKSSDWNKAVKISQDSSKIDFIVVSYWQIKSPLKWNWLLKPVSMIDSCWKTTNCYPNPIVVSCHLIQLL